MVRDRFKKSVGGLPLGDGFDRETERSGLLVTGVAVLGRSRDGPMGPSATMGDSSSSSWGDFA